MRPVFLIGLLNHLGPRWMIFRACYALRRKIGILARRSPPAEWGGEAAPLAELRLFANPPMPGPQSVAEANDILAGRFCLFSAHYVEAGFPPRWNRNQMTGEAAPCRPHWSTLAIPGDIKCIWELSRFAWAFPLARAYARTRESRYAEAFWVLFGNWMMHNTPNRGPNWMCGQEATFRLMAVTFASHVCASARPADAEFATRFRSFVTATGRRIAANIGYALSQSNNHGVSECVGMITAARLVPNRCESASWQRTGLDALEKQLAVLIYADGAFAQHSANYHRVLLHDLLWCISILRQTDADVPPWLVKAGQHALRFITALVNPNTGNIPLYGANDGANVLPLADADYVDYRPLVQAGAAVLHGQRWLPPGPWDEAAIWLGGHSALPDDVSPIDWMPTRFCPQGGVAQIRRGEGRLFLRCPTKFRHRPSQADLLHADIEWRGQGITRDAGTYGYDAGGRWAGALSEAAVHNTVTFDADEPMRRVARFLYLPWPSGSVRVDPDGSIEATHDGWRRLSVRHSRRVWSPGTEQFMVKDHIISATCRRVRLHWLLADLPYEIDIPGSRLVLGAPFGKYLVSWSVPKTAAVSLVRADATSNRGWWSPRYLQALPALSLAIEFDIVREVDVSTSFSPEV